VRRSPIASIAFAIALASFACNAAEDPLCPIVAAHLLPEKLSRGAAAGEQEEDAEGGRYVAHWVKYTDFCFDCGQSRYVLGSGFALYDDAGKLSLGQSDLFVSEHEYFVEGAWKESRRFSNLARSAPMQADPKLKALSTALFYLEYGKAADDFFRSTRGGQDIVRHLPRYGIRGSDIRYWYACQSCRKEVPAFTHSLSQDLRYARLAAFERGMAVVTTRPRVVIAMLEKQGISYHECPRSYGLDIERVSTFKE